jgi:hypothetical protein
VFLNGVYQVQGDDYNETSSSSITFTSALSASDKVAFVKNDVGSAIDAPASAVGYVPDGTGAVATNVQAKLRESVSVKDFGAVGDGTDEFTKILAAWTYCLANGKDLHFPAGIYSSGINNMPFKNATYPATTLLDCLNITISGDGPNTILRSDSVVGADVLNLYSVKNLHIRNMKITATLSGASVGSNGISIVGGFDNITLDHIWCENLPYVDTGTYLDGGKAFTIQTGTPTTECGTIKGTNLFAKGCVHGIGLEVDLVNFLTKKHAIDINIVAEDCHIGVLFSAGAATSALSVGATVGYGVKAQLINCQRNVVLGRVHGCNIEANIITTKSIAARRLNPLGGTWNSIDSLVDGLVCTYAKNSKLTVYGDIGPCDYKAQIGGTTAGSSGLNGATEYCDIYLDIGGISVTADINAVDSGGNSMSFSRLAVTSTTGTIPADFLAVAKINQLSVLGTAGTSLYAGSVRFPASQISSAGVNDFDDYEEGTFAPILADTGLADEGATYALNVGSYTKVGNRVTFNLYIGLATLGTLTGGDAAYILGLPYISLLTSGNLTACSIGFGSGLALGAGEIPVARIGSGDQYITLGKWPAAGTAGTSTMIVSDVSATGALVIAGSYRTAT